MLAVGVMFSHIPLDRLVYLGWRQGAIGDIYVGSVAVMMFCAISGYVMTKLVHTHFLPSGTSSEQFKTVLHYYVDRAARLFPQFLVYSSLTLAIIGLVETRTSYWDRLSLGDVVINMLMIPLGFNQWFPSVGLLIPQAWSLGLEWCFYLLIPWVLALRRWSVVYALGYASQAFFLLPFLGVINPFIFGYQLLPGVLYVFVIGMCQADSDARRRRTFELTTLLFGISLLVGLLYVFDLSHLDGAMTQEVLIGGLLSVLFGRFLRNSKSHGVDSLLGNLSYGVFLNHILVIELLAVPFASERRTIAFFLAVLVISTALSFMTFTAFERPVLRWRRGLRALARR